jgi:hypothetical protein
LASVGVMSACALSLPQFACGDVVSPPTVRQFGVWKDTNHNGVFDSGDQKLACVANMLQYYCAAQSYGYKQYYNLQGADLSGWPNSSDGPLTGQTHQTWLTPQEHPDRVVDAAGNMSQRRDVLQFWMGWSRLDHDADNPVFATAAKGYNFGIIMNQEARRWDPVTQTVINLPVPLDAPIRNNVRMNITVTGSRLTPTVVLSDNFSTAPADSPVGPYNPDELPIGPTPTAQFKATGPGTFAGDWSYRDNSTAGGVIGNLDPLAREFLMKIDLLSLGRLGPDGGTPIEDIMFYNFDHPPGTYDPFDPATYNEPYTRMDLSALAAGGLIDGDTIFITDCCTQTPEPLTLALLALGGLGAAGAKWHRRRAA